MASGYDGNKAARWALQHAGGRQPFVLSCSLFASKALWAGGLRQTDEWNERGMRGRYPGTETATVADTFTRHLIATGQVEPMVIYREPDLRPETVPQARKGDILAYDWYGRYGNGKYSHTAVVSLVRDGVPYVSEWGTAGSFNLVCFYLMRRWNWSENAQMYLGEHYADMVVTLLRVV